MTNKNFTDRISLRVQLSALTRRICMAKENRQRRDEKKKPQMSLKERRQKKSEKRQNKTEHIVDGQVNDFS